MKSDAEKEKDRDEGRRGMSGTSQGLFYSSLRLLSWSVASVSIFLLPPQVIFVLSVYSNRFVPPARTV